MRHRRELQQLTIDGPAEVVATLDLSPTWGGARPGAGRPRGSSKTRVISVRVSDELYLKVSERAQKSKKTVNQLLAAVLEEYVLR